MSTTISKLDRGHTAILYKDGWDQYRKPPRSPAYPDTYRNSQKERRVRQLTLPSLHSDRNQVLLLCDTPSWGGTPFSGHQGPEYARVHRKAEDGKGRSLPGVTPILGIRNTDTISAERRYRLCRATVPAKSTTQAMGTSSTSVRIKTQMPSGSWVMRMCRTSTSFLPNKSQRTTQPSR